LCGQAKKNVENLSDCSQIARRLGKFGHLSPTYRPSAADPSLPAGVGIVMSLGLRPKARRAAAGAVGTGE